MGTQDHGAGGPRPGWYADPEGSGGQRWWDGTRWTDQLAPPPLPPPPPSVGGWVEPRIPPGVELATPKQRLFAAVIDGLLSTVLVLGAYVLFLVGLFVETSALILLAMPLFLVGVIVAWVHLVLYTGRLGQTVGKHLLGIEVRHLPTGRTAIGVGTAFGREFIKGIGTQALFLGVLWLLWDDRRRCWHDMAVDTVVVRTDRPRSSLWAFLRSPFGR